MKQLIFSLVLFATCAMIILPLQTVLGYAYKVSRKMDMSPVEPGAPPSELGIVGDVRNCGGPGKVVQWRYEPCNGESPCQIPGDGKKRPTEMEFIPSSDTRMLGIRFNVITENGASTVYSRPLPNSSVQGGQTYVNRGAGGPPKEMVGRSYTFQYILYRVEDNSVELCAEADFVVVEP